MALDTYRIIGMYDLKTHAVYDTNTTANEWSEEVKRLYGVWPATVHIELTPEEFFELLQMLKNHLKHASKQEARG